MLTISLPTCQIEDSLSELCYVHSGVRHGSVLGPLLFVVFINDLPDFFQSATSFIYSDDTKLLQAIRSRSSEDTARLQSDINSASDWSISTDLLFNESKFIHLRYFSATVLTDLPKYIHYQWQFY